jgi:MFS family permease
MTAITVDAGLQPRRSFQEVWVISLGHALTHWYPATFYLLLPLIGKELGLSYSEIGSVLTCQYLAGAVANIPGGIFVDSVGRKGLLMAVSLFWIGFPYLMMGAAHAYWMILCCATLIGIGNNLWHPSAISWLANRFPQRKVAMPATRWRRSSPARSSAFSAGATSSLSMSCPACCWRSS